MRSTRVVARTGRKLFEFTAPGIVVDGVPEAASITQIAITARGFAAFVTRAPNTPDTLSLVDPSGARVQLDQGDSGTITAVHWTAPGTVRWRVGHTARVSRTSE